MKHKIAFAMIMGMVTTCIVSFTLISINVGYIPGFLGIWLKSWSIAYVVAIPAILVISPKVVLLVNYLLRGKTEKANM